MNQSLITFLDWEHAHPTPSKAHRTQDQHASNMPEKLTKSEIFRLSKERLIFAVAFSSFAVNLNL